MNRPDRPREECGIFGVHGYERAADLTYLGLYSLQHRGQDLVYTSHSVTTGTSF